MFQYYNRSKRMLHYVDRLAEIEARKRITALFSLFPTGVSPLFLFRCLLDGDEVEIMRALIREGHILSMNGRDYTLAGHFEKNNMVSYKDISIYLDKAIGRVVEDLRKYSATFRNPLADYPALSAEMGLVRASTFWMIAGTRYLDSLPTIICPARARTLLNVCKRDTREPIFTLPDDEGLKRCLELVQNVPHMVFDLPDLQRERILWLNCAVEDLTLTTAGGDELWNMLMRRGASLGDLIVGALLCGRLAFLCGNSAAGEDYFARVMEYCRV